MLVETCYEGRSVADAAQRLGIPAGTVKSRTYYALRALRLAHPGRTGATGGSTVLGFWVEDREAFDDIYTDLTGAGHDGHHPPHDAFWGGRYAVVEDPDRNGVGIMSPADPQRAFWPPIPPPHRT